MPPIRANCFGKFRIRECVVRLEKLRNPHKVTKNVARFSAATPPRQVLAIKHYEDKDSLLLRMDKQSSVGRPSKAVMMAREKEKAKLALAKSLKKAYNKSNSSIDLDYTPTVAAGRSRRAHKPNPKYASEDMITPRMMKQPQGPHASKSVGYENKSRKLSQQSDSISSVENFFKDSSDDEYEMMGMEKYIPSDSDFETIPEKAQEASPYVGKKRGRPPKPKEPLSNTPNAATSPEGRQNVSGDKPKTVIRTPAQWSQLRKTVLNNSLAGGSANRNQPNPKLSAQGINLVPKKRKIDMKFDSFNSSDSLNSEDCMSSENEEQTKRIKLAASAQANRKPGPASKAMNGAKLSIEQNRAAGETRIGSIPKPAVVRSRPGPASSKMAHQGQISSAKPVNMLGNKQKMLLMADQKLMKRSMSPKPYGSANKAAGATANKQSPNNNWQSSSAGGAYSMSNKPLSTLNSKSIISKPTAASSNKVPQLSAKSMVGTLKTPLGQKAKGPAALASKPMGRVMGPKSANMSRPAVAVKPSMSQKQGKQADASQSSTIDDFETMPTFTIVNINDIIKKKDVLAPEFETNSPPPSQQNSRRQSEVSNASGFEDEPSYFNKKNTQNKPAVGEPKKLPTIKPGTATSNRSPMQRKPQSMPSARKPAEKLSPSSNQMRLLNGKPGMGNRPAPRILNSMVAKRMQPVEPKFADPDDSTEEPYALFSELDDDSDPTYEQPGSKNNNKRKWPPSPIAKKNLKSQLSAPQSPARPPTHVKRESAQVFSSPDGTTTQDGDKKVTCYEKWNIINVKRDEPYEPPNNQLVLPLIQLANSIESVKLPSSKWSRKITLHQVAPSVIAKPQYTLFTGDLSDQGISEADRAKYQPSCVMFRRAAAQQPKTRLPYDRAVIFKNKTFFSNIDGKNVRLNGGAPSVLNNLDDVQVLVELIDYLTLQNSFVTHMNPA